MKNLKLTKNEFKNKLEEYFGEQNIKIEIMETECSPKMHKFEVVIAGNPPFLYAIYDTPKGLTVQPQGSIQDFANEVLEAVVSNIVKVEVKEQEFTGITLDTYNNIKDYFTKNNEIFQLSENICSAIQTNLTISRGAQSVILKHYHTTFRLFLSGQSTHLWDDIFFAITDNLSLNARDIVSIYLKTKKEMQDIQITYDEGILDELISCSLGKEIYNDVRIVTDVEKKWLKTSAFLLYTEIQLPEYYPAIASAIKVIEGVLNRICFEKISTHEAGNFDYFAPNQKQTVWALKLDYKRNFSNNSNIIHLVNDLYNFIRNNRHTLFHNDGVNPRSIVDKNIVIAIFQEIFTLLIQANKYADIIFK